LKEKEMNMHKHPWRIVILLLSFAFITLSCSLFSTLGLTDITNPTPTPTIIGGVYSSTKESKNIPCEGLSGTLELQLLVGPSEAVGLEPYTFAEIPFQVVKENNSYLITAAGPIDYYEAVLEADWGSFSVQFEGETTVSGECISTEDTGQLTFLVEMAGEQTVVVNVEGMETTYPWAGTPQIEASFPIVDGAQVSGEGWSLILHLN
jgi:hypothetical protein